MTFTEFGSRLDNLDILLPRRWHRVEGALDPDTVIGLGPRDAAAHFGEPVSRKRRRREASVVDDSD